jgi:hypothetical protein
VICCVFVLGSKKLLLWSSLLLRGGGCCEGQTVRRPEKVLSSKGWCSQSVCHPTSSHSMRKLTRSSHAKCKTTKKHQQVASTLNINTGTASRCTKVTTGIYFIFKQTKWLDSQPLFQQYASLTQAPAEVSPLPVHGELLITFHEEVMPAIPVSVKISRAASSKRQPER